MSETIATAASRVVDRVHARAVQVMKLAAPTTAYALADLALSYPGNHGGYRYLLERWYDRRTVGCLEGDRGGDDDPILEYCLVALSNGTIFEIVERREEPGLTEIWHDACRIGHVARMPDTELNASPRPPGWKLWFGGRPFGEVTCPPAVHAAELAIRRAGGPSLPLVLARRDRWADRMATADWRDALRMLFAPFPPNADHVMPPSVAPRTLGAAEPFYFAVALLFRAVYFKAELLDAGA